MDQLVIELCGFFISAWEKISKRFRKYPDHFYMSGCEYSSLLAKFVKGQVLSNAQNQLFPSNQNNRSPYFHRCEMLCPYKPLKWFQVALADDSERRKLLASLKKGCWNSVNFRQMPWHHQALYAVSQQGVLQVSRFLCYTSRDIANCLPISTGNTIQRCKGYLKSKHTNTFEGFCRFLGEEGSERIDEKKYQVCLVCDNQPLRIPDFQVFDDWLAIEWKKRSRLCVVTSKDGDRGDATRRIDDAISRGLCVRISGRTYNRIICDLRKLKDRQAVGCGYLQGEQCTLRN